MRTPCVRCGRLVMHDDGAPRVSVTLDVVELMYLIDATADSSLRARFECALELIDEQLSFERSLTPKR